MACSTGCPQGDGGFHLRLRFKGDSDSINVLQREVDDLLVRELPRITCTSPQPMHGLLPLPYQADTFDHVGYEYGMYEPEYEKYGGHIGVDIAEGFLYISSELALEMMLDLENLNMPRRALLALLPSSGKLILIGHSGGGVAVLRGVQLWKGRNCCLVDRSHVQIFQVGSPKAFLESDYSLVHYVYNGMDPITTLGIWGWNYPASQDPVLTQYTGTDPTGFNLHASYFDRNWSLVSGKTNLQVTMEAIVKYKP